MLNLGSILIGSSDPARLAGFYKEVLQTGPEWQSPEGGFVGYRAGSASLFIGPHDKVQGGSQNPERILINFETEDVRGEFERIKGIEGASIIQEPYTPSLEDSITIATLADPDNNYFQLESPLKNKRG